MHLTVPGFDGIHFGVVEDVYTFFLQKADKVLGEGLKTPGISHQAGGTGVHPCPHPGHVHLMGKPLAEFTDEHGFPHFFINFISGPFAHPCIYRGGFHRFPIIGQAQVHTHEAKADLVRPAQARIHQRSRNGIERIKFALVIHHCLGGAANHFVLQSQFADDLEHVMIRGKPVVVELLHRPLPFEALEAGSQAARVIGPLENGDLVAGTHKVERRRKPTKTSADDRNLFCCHFPPLRFTGKTGSWFRLNRALIYFPAHGITPLDTLARHEISS